MDAIPAQFLERISDWMNPILVKETRQALKSRSFVATFMLLLIASWLICMFGVASAGPSLDYGSPSQNFLIAFNMVLSAAVLVIIPFGAFRSLVSEQDSQTFELLNITSLTARQIVLGKLSNSILQVLVFYSAIAPFIAFTSLLQGFDLFATIVSLLVLKFVSILACAFTMMLSTASRNRQFQAIGSIFIIGGLVALFSSMSGFSVALLQGEMNPDLDFFIGAAAGFLIGASYFLLFVQVTISQLVFESGNRSTGIRIIASLQLLLLWGLIIITHLVMGWTIDDDVYISATLASLLHISIFCFFSTMERDELSRRIRRDLPKSGFLRLLLVPFMPGGTRGLIYLLINLGILIGFMTATYPGSSRVDGEFIAGIFATMSYIVIYLGMGSWIARRLHGISTELKPMHARTIMLIIFAFGAIMPHIYFAITGYMSRYNSDYQLIQITDPFSTIAKIGDGGRGTDPTLLLAVGALVILTINLPAMLTAFRQILAPERPQSRSPLPVPESVVTTPA